MHSEKNNRQERECLHYYGLIARNDAVDQEKTTPEEK